MSSSINPLRRFWLLLKPDKKEIRNVYVYAFFYGLVNLSLPLGIQSIINLIQGGQMSTSWVVLIVFVIIGIVFSGILQIQQLKITEHLQQKIFARAAFEFAYRIPKIRLEALYKHYAPELMNRFFDVVSIQKGLAKILIDFSGATIQAVFGLLLLSLYHPFFIVFSLILLVLVYSIFKLTAKKGLETSLKESKGKYKVASWLEELARTSITFKLAGKTELPMDRVNDGTKDYVVARDAHFKVLKTQYSLMILFKVLIAAGLLIVGSILVMDQKMNIGQFVASEIIILLVLGSVEKIIVCLETVYDVLTSLEKVGQVTDLELEADTGMKFPEEDGNHGLTVELQNVDFKYPGSNKFIYKDASIKISSGERVMITGDSDIGKTTLLYLLGGLYKVKAGSLIFNDIPFGNINPNLLRMEIGDCFMEELLFEGTLLENISMGREKASFENVKWACEAVGLKETIKSYPAGYNTMIDAQGKQFSKGIVDRIILARSIAEKPKLLLIKDLFSSLSDTDRKSIFDFLVDRKNEWTLVIASKDAYLGGIVDKVYTPQSGSLIETSKNDA